MDQEQNQNHSHDHHEHEHTHEHHDHAKRRFTLTTPLAIIIGAVLIAGGLVVHGLVSGGSGDPTIALETFTGKTVKEDTYKEGKGKVYVVEYSDAECPYCILFHPAIKQLRTDYKDKITYLYRNFPLTSIHEHALAEAKDISCAGSLGGNDVYFKYITALFDKKTTDNRFLLPGQAEDLAKSFGIDVNKFTECTKSPATETEVMQSTQDGVNAGVNATPTTFILVAGKDGALKILKSIPGAANYSYIKAAVDQALLLTK